MMPVQAVFFMPICPHCQRDFLLRQTFADLFRLETVCPRCRRLSNREIRREVLPLSGSECHIFSFHHADHPVLTARIFAMTAQSGNAIVFVEEGLLSDRVALLHLASLMRPLRLYRAEFFTMDEIETLMIALDADPSFF